MLQIYTDGHLTDLAPDISIDLVMENPLFSAERIPATFSLSYALPLTPRNMQIFGNPDRITSSGDRTTKYPCRILFAGVEIAAGVETLEEVDTNINVNFSGSVLPENINRRLWAVPMQTLDLAGYNGSEWSAQVTLNSTLRENMTNRSATFFAPPIAIGDASKLERDPDNADDLLLNTRAQWLNPMHMTAESYLHYMAQGPQAYTLKIMPAVRVWYIIDSIFDGRLANNIFKTGEWDKLSLQTLWHPKYNLSDNFPCWDLTPGDPGPTITFSLSDFMPDVTAAEFLVEMLKLPCASMYIRGDRYDIEYNHAVLGGNIVHQWSDRIIGTPTIGVERGQSYQMGYTDTDDTEVQPEGEISDADDVATALHRMSGGISVRSCRLSHPRQIFTSILDGAGRTPCSVVQQDMPTDTSSEAEPQSTDDQTDVYDMTIAAQVVRCTVQRYWINDDYIDHEDGYGEKIYTPEISKIETKRPDTLLLGLWQGMQNDIRMVGGAPRRYPYLGATNYNSNGERLGDLSLFWNDRDGLKKHHAAFAAWIKRDKTTLSASVKLSALDLHNLDLRHKFNVRGRLFFIRSLNVSLMHDKIQPAKVGFVEV